MIEYIQTDLRMCGILCVHRITLCPLSDKDDCVNAV